MRRGFILMVVVVLGVAACGDDATTVTTGGGETTFTTAGEQPTTTEATTTTTEAPQLPGAAFILNGETGVYVWALQGYLDCAGYGPIDIDGIFGDGTAASVSKAQADQNKAQTGEPDEGTFAWLARACFDARDIVFGADDVSSEVAGNAAPGDDEILVIRVLEGQEMTIEVDGAVDVTIQGEDGVVLHRPDGSTVITVDIPTTQDYTLRVSASSPTSFSLTITIPAGGAVATSTTMAETAGFLLAVDGFSEIDFGTESGETLTFLIAEFGPPITDTGWVEVEDSVSECGSVSRTVTWEFEASEGNAATTLEVIFHDRGYSNPAFARWDYRLTDHEDGSEAGVGVLATAYGLSVGNTHDEAQSHGFVLGGFEESGHGRLDGIDIHIFSFVDDYDQDGFVGSIGAGTWVCASEL